MLFSFQRGGVEALGLRTGFRRWRQQPGDWQGFSRTGEEREPLGSDIHLVTALILPAPSRVTVSRAP